MNSWQKELGPKGLVVVGVTNEPDSLVGKDIEKSRIKHPTALVSGDETDTFYGIEAFPSGFVVDTRGMVVWAGNPFELDTDTLAKWLEEVVVPPPLPEEHKAIDVLLRSGKLGKAHVALEKALAKAESAELKAAAEFVTAEVDRRLGAAQKAIEEQEYGRALELYQALAVDCAGVPGADAAKPAADALKKDKAAAPEIAAAAKLADVYDTWRKGDFEKALKACAGVAKKFADTPSGRRAAEMASRHGY